MVEYKVVYFLGWEILFVGSDGGNIRPDFFNMNKGIIPFFLYEIRQRFSFQNNDD